MSFSYWARQIQNKETNKSLIAFQVVMGVRKQSKADGISGWVGSVSEEVSRKSSGEAAFELISFHHDCGHKMNSQGTHRLAGNKQARLSSAGLDWVWPIWTSLEVSNLYIWPGPSMAQEPSVAPYYPWCQVWTPQPFILALQDLLPSILSPHCCPHQL